SIGCLLGDNSMGSRWDEGERGTGLDGRCLHRSRTRSGASFRLDHCQCRDLDVAGEAQEPHGADDEIGHIDLPPAETVARGSREGVVVVVPSLAQADDAEDEVVAAFIAALEWARAPDVAD